MNFYKRNVGNYAKKTGHLSALEHGVYTLLLDRYYVLEGPISKADVYRISKTSNKAERAATDAVLAEFFTLEGDHYRHERCDEEVAAYQAQAETNREIARQREARKRPAGNARTLDEQSTNRSTTRSTNRLTIGQTNDQPNSEIRIQKEQKPRSNTLERQAARFDEFWASYPVKKGRAAALAKWKAVNLDPLADTILADVVARLAGDRQWLAGFIPHGSTYVIQRGWEDAIDPPKLRAVAVTGYAPLPGER